ncbi:MAG: hypothetical protein HUN04_16495 [Desulfobacter sp.]|nr:MAG: hypothetical protein HUN04_16495 [Desulfobacter sp.]
MLIESKYSDIVISDGVSEEEMIIIAQNYMLNHPDSLCEEDALKVNLANPSIKCGWVDKGDNGCYVGFRSNEAFSFRTLFIKVSSESGKAWCGGYLILK